MALHLSIVSFLESPMSDNKWKSCSTCKKDIPLGGSYYECSVSTCRRKRKGFRFCSVPCWDAHLGYMNHREAWAEERTAPLQPEAIVGGELQKDRSSVGNSTERAPRKRVIHSSTTPSSSSAASTRVPSTTGISTDTLVVVSKVKKLIKDQSGFNTSQCGIDALTKKVVEESLKGIEKAKQSGRKTVMGRDIV